MVDVNSRDRAIELVRVVAMFMIIFDHMIEPINLPLKSIFSQFFNSGIYIFIFLSGYLAGQKEICNWKKWYIKKIKRIMIPYWIVIAVCFAYETICLHNFNWKLWLVMFCNLQGIFGTTYTTVPLWFVTIIMILYLLTPIYSKMKKNRRYNFKIILFMLISLQIIFAYTTDVGLQYGHNLSWCIVAMTCYGIGFFAKKNILKKINKKIIIHISIITMLMLGITVIIRYFFDGTYFYDKVIAYDSMTMLALCLALWVYKIYRQDRFKQVIDWLDGISYEFYLTHKLIIVAVTSLVLENYGTVAYLVTTIVITIILAWVVSRLNRYINTKLG